MAAFEGEAIRELPTTRNIRSILTLTPGLTATGLGADCVGGVGVWCNNNIYNLSAHTATNDTEGGRRGASWWMGRSSTPVAAPASWG